MDPPTRLPASPHLHVRRNTWAFWRDPHTCLRIAILGIPRSTVPKCFCFLCVCPLTFCEVCPPPKRGYRHKFLRPVSVPRSNFHLRYHTKISVTAGGLVLPCCKHHSVSQLPKITENSCTCYSAASWRARPDINDFPVCLSSASFPFFCTGARSVLWYQRSFACEAGCSSSSRRWRERRLPLTSSLETRSRRLSTRFRRRRWVFVARFGVLPYWSGVDVLIGIRAA